MIPTAVEGKRCGLVQNTEQKKYIFNCVIALRTAPLIFFFSDW